jgi:hypothetical protein
MKQVRFEPFGEPIAQKAESGQDRPASKWLLWAGSAVFWSMVAVIVAARAAYFDTGVFNFDHLAAVIRTIL